MALHRCDFPIEIIFWVRLVACIIWFMYGMIQNNNDPFVWLGELYQSIQDEAIPFNTLFY